MNNEPMTDEHMLVASKEGANLARKILANAWLILLSGIPVGTDTRIDDARRVFEDWIRKNHDQTNDG